MGYSVRYSSFICIQQLFYFKLHSFLASFSEVNVMNGKGENVAERNEMNTAIAFPKMKFNYERSEC